MTRAERIEAAARAYMRACARIEVRTPSPWNEEAALSAALALPADPPAEPTERERALVHEALTLATDHDVIDRRLATDTVLRRVDATHPRPIDPLANATRSDEGMPPVPDLDAPDEPAVLMRYDQPVTTGEGAPKRPGGSHVATGPQPSEGLREWHAAMLREYEPRISDEEIAERFVASTFFRVGSSPQSADVAQAYERAAKVCDDLATGALGASHGTRRTGYHSAYKTAAARIRALSTAPAAPQPVDVKAIVAMVRERAESLGVSDIQIGPAQIREIADRIEREWSRS